MTNPNDRIRKSIGVILAWTCLALTALADRCIPSGHVRAESLEGTSDEAAPIEDDGATFGIRLILGRDLSVSAATRRALAPSPDGAPVPPPIEGEG